MFDAMGFEHLPEGYVLMNPRGGVSYAHCSLLAPALVDAIEAALAAGNEDPSHLPEAILGELTQGAKDEGERQHRLSELFSGDVVSVYCVINHLWYQGHTLTVATKPLPLPAFIQAVQVHGNQVHDLNLVTHWTG
jgi:hypothetical protein